MYLGSSFTSYGLVSSAIKLHANTKMCQALKYVSFSKKNNDIPFFIKKKVFDAALMSSLLYGCETWLEGDVQPVNKLYMMCLKHLLGVRSNITNNLCLVELGYPTVKALIKARQRKFLKNMFNERRGMVDDPFNFVINNVLNGNFSTARYMKGLIDRDEDDIGIALREAKLKITNAHDSSRCMHYKEVNPDLSFSCVYGPGPHHINELFTFTF